MQNRFPLFYYSPVTIHQSHSLHFGQSGQFCAEPFKPFLARRRKGTKFFYFFLQSPITIHHSPVTFFTFWTIWTLLCRTIPSLRDHFSHEDTEQPFFTTEDTEHTEIKPILPRKKQKARKNKNRSQRIIALHAIIR